MMIVQMSQEEVRICTSLATERWLTKFGSVDKPNYAAGKAAGRLEHELLANIRANICEWAAAKAYNVAWNLPWYPNHLHPQRKDIADIDGYEVRTIRTQSSIPFWEKDINRNIIGTKVLDEDYYTNVEVFGRFRAKDFANDVYFDSSISGWRVPVNQIRE